MKKFHSRLVEVFRRLTGGRIARGTGLVAVALLLTALALRAQTFTWPLDISNNSSMYDYSAQVAVNETTGEIYVVWQEHMPYPADPTPSKIYFSKSTDGGSSFSTPMLLSGSLADCAGPQIAVDPYGNIDVIWQNNADAEIYFTRSTDSGETFSTPVNISNNSGVSVKASFALEPDGSIDVVWYDSTGTTSDNNFGIMFNRGQQTGSGFTFLTSAVTVAPPGGTGAEHAFTDPQVAVDSYGKIHVVWYDFLPGGDVYYSSGTVSSSGVTFLASPEYVTDTTDTTKEVTTALLGLDGHDNIYVAWSNKTTDEIYLRRRMYGYGGFEIPVDASNSAGESRLSRMVVDPTTAYIYLIWREHVASSYYNVYFSRSNDQGASFSDAEPIYEDSTLNQSPFFLGVDSSGEINVGWIRGDGDAAEIYFSSYPAIFPDKGTTFLIIENISHTSGEASTSPAMAMDSSGKIYAVWNDYPGNDVYFSLGTPTVPFTTLDAKLKFLVGPPPGFNLQASATLPEGSDPIDMDAPVMIVAGPDIVMIPAGSFKELQKGKKAGSFVYSGVIDDVTVSAQIVVLEDGYQIKASASGGSLFDPSGLVGVPVEVVVTVGQYSSSTTVIPSF